jgi:hypothetical protein
MPRLSDETRIERLQTARNKGGNSIYSGRKLGKVTDESKMLPAELEWAKSYAAVLKAAGWSYRYISDTTMVQTGIVKAWFEEKEVQEKVAQVQADIIAGAVGLLKNYAVDLVEMLMELARTTADDSVRLKAIESGLDRVGVAKTSRSESIVTKNERTEFDISAETFEKMEALPLETQEQIARLAAEMEAVIENAKGNE